MTEDIGDGIKINGQWRNNAKKWFWKLAFSIISVKVMVTAAIIVITTCLIVYKNVNYLIINNGDGSQSVIEINQPYITAENWSYVIVSVVVAFLGVRVLPSVISSVSEGLGNRRNNRDEIPIEEPEDNEEDAA